MRLYNDHRCLHVYPTRRSPHLPVEHRPYPLPSLCCVRLPPGTPKNNRNRGCFCIRGSPCVLIKRTLLCSRTLRLALHFRCKHLRYAISSLCSFRLPPRVHQWHSDFIAMPQLCLPFGKHNFTLAQAKISPPKAISFALSEFHSFQLLLVQT